MSDLKIQKTAGFARGKPAVDLAELPFGALTTKY